MTREDYVAIAAALKGERATINQGYYGLTVPCDRTINVVAVALADVMARDNPRFDRKRFLKAAGVQS